MALSRTPRPCARDRLDNPSLSCDAASSHTSGHDAPPQPFFNFTEEKHQKGTGKNRAPLGDRALLLPGARSNVWPRSWKRFLIDFMYGRVSAASPFVSPAPSGTTRPLLHGSACYVLAPREGAAQAGTGE